MRKSFTEGKYYINYLHDFTKSTNSQQNVSLLIKSFTQNLVLKVSVAAFLFDFITTAPRLPRNFWVATHSFSQVKLYPCHFFHTHLF